MSIVLILSFNLISEVEKATTSFEASILPSVAELLILPTAIDPRVTFKSPLGISAFPDVLKIKKSFVPGTAPL